MFHLDSGGGHDPAVLPGAPEAAPHPGVEEGDGLPGELPRAVHLAVQPAVHRGAAPALPGEPRRPARVEPADRQQLLRVVVIVHLQGVLGIELYLVASGLMLTYHVLSRVPGDPGFR